MRILVFMVTLGLLMAPLTQGLAQDSSKALTQTAAEALAKSKTDLAIKTAQSCIDQFGEEAKKIQNKIKGQGEKIFKGEAKAVFEKYRVLNDVGMCQFIIGEAYRMQGKSKEANQAYKKIIDEYPESRSLEKTRVKNFVLNKIADIARFRMKLDSKSEFYKLPANITVY